MVGLCLLLLGQLPAAATPTAAQPLTLSDQALQDGIALGFHLDYLVQPEAADASAITDGEYDAAFRFDGHYRLSLGTGHRPIWARVSLNNPGTEPLRLVLRDASYHIKRLDLFAADSGRLIGSAGNAQSLLPRATRFHTIEFQLPPGLHRFYIRQESTFSLLDFTLSSPQGFQVQALQENLSYGLMLGCLVAVACYNLFLFLLFREREYGYYVLYIITAFVGQSENIGLLWFLQPYDEARAAASIPLMMLVFSFLFFATYLNLAQRMPSAYRLGQLINGVAVATLVLIGVFGPEQLTLVTRLLILLAPLVYLGFGLYGMRQRHRPSYFFSAAWVTVVLSTSYVMLTLLGILETYSWTRYLVTGSIAAESVLLSLALGYKMAELNRDRDLQISLKQNAEAKNQIFRELLDLSARFQSVPTLRQALLLVKAGLEQLFPARHFAMRVVDMDTSTAVYDFSEIGIDPSLAHALHQTDKAWMKRSHKMHARGRKVAASHDLILEMRGPALEEAEREIMDVFWQELAQLVETRLHSEQIRAQARLDPLTGLYNRAYFNEVMASLLQDPKRPAVILFCDINGLKRINDTYGHNSGDTLIRVAASVLSEAMPEGCQCFRIGGDELVALCPGYLAEDGPMLIARIRELEAEASVPCLGKNRVDVIQEEVRLSIGSAGTDEVGPDMLLDVADRRMISNKEAWYADRGQERYR